VTAWTDAESSAQDSSPRETIVISVNSGVQIWRHASGSEDLVIDGLTYTAIAMERSEVAITTPKDQNDVTLTLPIDHPLCSRWTQQASPPSNVSVTVYRTNGGLTRQYFAGTIQEMHADGGVARFRCSSRVGEWLLRVIPSIAVNRRCPYAMFSAPCGVSRTGSSLAGTPNFATVTVTKIVTDRQFECDLSTIPFADPYRASWAVNGEVFFAETGEYASVRNQYDLDLGVSTVTKLELHEALVGLAVGKTVTVYVGCSKVILDCSDQHNNRQNFGGIPTLGLVDPYKQVGSGGVSAL
jgi:hypothetical protein